MTLGLLLRVALLWETRDTPLVAYDERDYYALAENLVHRGEFALVPGRLTSMRPPLYPAFVAAVFKLTGWESPQAVRVAQVGVSAVLALCTFVLGKRVFGRRAGIAAAVAVWLYPSFLLANCLVLTELLFALLVVLSAIAFGSLVERPSWWRGLLLGLAIGCAALTRSVLWPFPLVLVPMLLVAAPGRPRTRLAIAACVLAGYGLAVGPWAVRNTRLQHVPVVIDTMGGINLRIGNYEWTPDERMWSAPFEFTGERSWSAALPQQHPDAPAWTDGQKDKWAQRKAVEFILSHPWVTARRCLIRFADFWGLEREFVALIRDGKYHVPAWFAGLGGAATVLAYPILILLAVFGAFCATPSDWRTCSYCLLLTLFVCGVHCLVFAHSRYRLPLTGIFAVFAAAAFVQRPSPAALPGWRRSAAFVCAAILLVVWARQLAFSDLPRVLDFVHEVSGT